MKYNKIELAIENNIYEKGALYPVVYPHVLYFRYINFIAPFNDTINGTIDDVNITEIRKPKLTANNANFSLVLTP